MKINKLKISHHAERRMAQRNIDIGDVALVLTFGRGFHRAGAEFQVLLRRDIPPGLEKTLEPLVGTVVVIEDGLVLTVYTNSNAPRTIKRKPKRSAGQIHWRAAEDPVAA